MAVDLMKGGKVKLQKDNPALALGECGLGWDISQDPAKPFDLDFFMIELNADGKAASGDASLIFYNNPKNTNGSVYVKGDNRTGDAAGYDEQGFIKFADVPAGVQSVIVCVSVFQAAERRQNFGQVNNAICDVLNSETGEKLTHYDLTEDMSMASGFVAGMFKREADGLWSFKALGDTFNDGMPGILTKYGIQH